MPYFGQEINYAKAFSWHSRNIVTGLFRGALCIVPTAVGWSTQTSSRSRAAGWATASSASGYDTSTAQRPFSSNGSIRNWNYGPNGDINGFTLDRNVLVMFPPEFGATLASMARLGSRVSISGDSRGGVNVQTVVDAQSLTVNGRTINVGVAAGALPAPTRPAAPARGRRGPPPPTARVRGIATSAATRKRTYSTVAQY